MIAPCRSLGEMHGKHFFCANRYSLKYRHPVDPSNFMDCPRCVFYKPRLSTPDIPAKISKEVKP